MENGAPIRKQRMLALLAGVALAVAAGAAAGYWAGARAARGPGASSEPALRAELQGMGDRIVALERLEAQRAAALLLGSPGRDAAELPAEPGGAVPLPAPRPGPDPDAEPAPGLARGLAGAMAGRWIESLEELENTRDPARRKALALELARSPIPPLRIEGLRTLLELDSGEGLSAVRQLVADADQNPRAQRMAAQGVALLGGVSGRDVDDALYGFTSSTSAGVQRAALRTLEQRGDSEPMRASIAAQQPALQSGDAGTRSRALREIGALRSPSAVPTIVPLLRDADSGVRIQALDALSRTGGGEAALAAVEPLLSDPVPAVRDTAVRTVQRLGRGPVDPRPEPGGGFRSGR